MRALISLCIIGLLFVSCAKKETFKVQTVNEQITTNQLGQTLIHEHILVDFIGADSTGYHRWDPAEVVESVLPFLREAKELGFRTLLECTPAYLGRDPQLLKALSDSSGLQILTNSGYYGAYGRKYLPEHAYSETADQLAARWINEFENGIEDTDIKPGFIKISVNDSVLSEMSQKIVRAAARTHLATGLTIASHTGPAIPAYEEMEILEVEGVALEAFIWVHAQAEKDLVKQIEAAKRGVWISMDGLRDDNIEEYLNYVNKFKSENLLHKLLISHDAGWYRPGEENGGEFRGYTALSKKLIPMLRAEGISQDEIDQIVIKNPASAFAIRVRSITN